MNRVAAICTALCLTLSLAALARPALADGRIDLNRSLPPQSPPTRAPAPYDEPAHRYVGFRTGTRVGLSTDGHLDGGPGPGDSAIHVGFSGTLFWNLDDYTSMDVGLQLGKGGWPGFLECEAGPGAQCGGGYGVGELGVAFSSPHDFPLQVYIRPSLGVGFFHSGAREYVGLVVALRGGLDLWFTDHVGAYVSAGPVVALLAEDMEDGGSGGVRDLWIEAGLGLAYRF